MGMLAPLAMQEALAEFIGSGAYLGHVRRMNRLYKERRDHMLQALAAEAGSRLTVEAPAGGMQLLARCRGSTNDRELSARLLRRCRQPSAVEHAVSPERRARPVSRFCRWNGKEIEQAAPTSSR